MYTLNPSDTLKSTLSERRIETLHRLLYIV